MQAPHQGFRTLLTGIALFGVAISGGCGSSSGGGGATAPGGSSAASAASASTAGTSTASAGGGVAATPSASTSAVIKAAPSGVAVSAATTEANSATVDATVPFSRTTLIRRSWSLLEPAPGVYDWQRLDDELARAAAARQKVTLVVMNGDGAPDWLFAAPYNARSLDYLFRGTTPFKLPLPWDATYLDRWEQFVAALGARYDKNSALALVHMTNSTGNGAEMQYNFDAATEQDFRDAGYTEDALVSSWERVLDAFAQAFPTTSLDNDVHPVFRSDVPAQRIVSYGHSTIGARYGVSAWWFSRKHAENDYPGMMTLLRQAADRSFATVQFVGNCTRQPDRFGNFVTGQELLALQDVVDYARAQLGNDVYMEIWPVDLENANFASYLQSLGY